MYKVELNIGSLSLPISGSGWLEVACVYSGATLERELEGDLRIRDALDGSFVFYGNVFTALDSMTDLNIPIRVSIDGTIRITSDLSLIGKYDEKHNRCELTAEQTDEYTTLLKNLDTEVDLTTLEETEVSTAFTTSLDTLARGWESGFSGAIPLIDDYLLFSGSNSPPPWNAGWNYIAAEEISGYPKLWGGDSDYSFCLFGGVVYIAITDNTNRQPDIYSITPDPDWLVMQGIYYDKFGQERGDYQFDEDAVWDISLNKWRLANTTTANYTYEQTFYKLFDLLEELVTTADPANNIIESSYCTYFDTYFPDLKELYIATFKDEANISLSEVIEMMLNKFNLRWELDSLLFKFKHPRQTGLSTGTDLTSFKGSDWSVYEYEYDPADKVGKEIWQFGESNRTDFKRQGITYDNSITDFKEYTDGYNTDYIVANGTQDGLILVIIDSGNIKTGVGAVSGSTIINADLSVANCIQDHLKYNRPFATGEINGSDETLNTAKNNIVNLAAPVRYLDEIDFTRSVITGLADLELKSIKIKLDNSAAILEGRYA